VAELSESIAICTEWLNLFTNKAMQTRLSVIYEQYFDFFRKVAIWYMKPKPSKWLDSFNSNFVASYDSAANTIKRSIKLIDKQAQIETAHEVKLIGPRLDQGSIDINRVEALVAQSRKEQNELGGNMYDLLLEMASRCKWLFLV
jgi:hypothetical protein